MTSITQQRVTIGDVTLPIGLHSIILARFLKEKDLKSLYDSYTEAKKTMSRVAGPPTELQVKMAKMKKTGKTSKEVAKFFSVTNNKVNSAVSRVAVWAYLNS